ncbi:MAG TPA: hypothetical protein VL337_05855 [Acidimicrobiales bacterium]|jgi:hypothetical protein|nr:hypothetical protein [Acidimicrobiales bacterium]
MLRSLIRIGFARGIGGSRGWLAVGITAGGLHLLRRAVKREADVVYLEELRPGQSLVIQHFPRVD